MPGCGVWHSLLLAALIHLVGSSNLQDVFFLVPIGSKSCVQSCPDHAKSVWFHFMSRLLGWDKAIVTRFSYCSQFWAWMWKQMLSFMRGRHENCESSCYAHDFFWVHLGNGIANADVCRKHLQKIFLKTDKISLLRNVYMVEHQPPPFV